MTFAQYLRLIIFSQSGIVFVLFLVLWQLKKKAKALKLPYKFTFEQNLSIILCIYAFIYMCINMAIRWSADPTWRIPVVFCFILGFEYYLYDYRNVLKSSLLKKQSIKEQAKYHYYSAENENGEPSVVTIRASRDFMKENKPLGGSFIDEIKKDTGLEVTCRGIYLDHDTDDYVFSYQIIK